MSVQLRPYQVAAVQEARRLVSAGNRRILMISPCGSGKTILFCDIIRGAMARGSRSLVLAHRRELILQTSDKLDRFDVPHGIVMSGVRPAPQRLVQVASKDTIIRNRAAMPDCDVVVIDEAHHAVAPTYERIISWYPRAKVIMVTATPWRADGRGLSEITDAHVIVSTPTELRDQGWLVPVDAYEYRAIQTDGLKTRGGDYVVDGQMEERATKAELMGSVVDEWIVHAHQCRTIVFGVTVAHSMALCARFRAAGVAAEHVDGSTPTGERDAIFARVRSGQTQVLTNCGVATEGVDVPEWECAVLARPTKSLGLAIQQWGRILRPAPGKVRARIHDHAGVLSMHGHPYDARNYSPRTDSSDVDAALSKRESESGGRLKCPACGAVLVLGENAACSACGHEFGAMDEVLDAERVEVKEGGERRNHGQTWTVHERREQWASKSFADKIEFLARMIKKHGPRRAPRVYYWLSGETQWPSKEISRAAYEMAGLAQEEAT